MGSSFVGIGERGFWMRDGILELWLRLLALHIEDPSVDKPDPITRKIRDKWLLQSRGFFNGFVTADLEGAIATKQGEQIVRAAIGSLMQALQSAPSQLNKDVLNLLGMEGTWGKDFEKWRLIEVGQAFIDLLDGKITTEANNTSFMPGCKDRGDGKDISA